MAFRRLWRAARVVGTVVLALLVLTGTTGWMTFTTAHTDPLQHADAVVVLAGEHDGREDYGISLAAGGWARIVVLSDPYSGATRSCGDHAASRSWASKSCVRTPHR